MIIPNIYNGVRGWVHSDVESMNCQYYGNVYQSQKCKYTLMQKFCVEDYKPRRQDKIMYKNRPVSITYDNEK